MTHAMTIRISRKKLNGGLVTCRGVTVRERLLRFLLGAPAKLTIIVPGDSVNEVGITETAVSAEEAEAPHETA